MHRAIVAAVAAVIIAGCSSSGDDNPEPAKPTATADPYEEWLARAPSDAPSLSRDDALARALLGCGSTWPPGTTDAILQEVYHVC